MTYWISGYILGMLVTAALMAWGAAKGGSDYTHRQLGVAGLLVLFWPPWLALMTGVAMFSVFAGLFGPKPKRKTT